MNYDFNDILNNVKSFILYTHGNTN